MRSPLPDVTGRTMAILPARVDIFDAASHDDIVEVRKFIQEKHVLANATNSVGQTAGHIAAKNGNLRVAKAVLDADASIAGMRDRWNQTMLHLATQKGAIRIVRMLIDEYGIDYLEPNHLLQGITVLHMAAAMGHVHVLKYYIGEKKMDANVKNRFGQPPAFNAAANGYVYAIRYLGDETNANLTMVDNNGDNILYMSARRGDLSVPRFLLTEKKIPFDINWRNILGETVLNRAIVYDHYQFIKFIVEEKHADINLADFEGSTPLHEAAAQGDFVLVGYLLQHGANPSAKNAEGKTPAQVATDAAVIRRLEEPNKTKKQMKVRRSVYSPGVSNVHLSPTHLMTEVRKGIGSLDMENNSGWGGSDIVSRRVNLNDSLAFSSFFFSYFTGSHSRPVRHASLLSPPEMLRIRMDSLALDSIRTLFR